MWPSEAIWRLEFGSSLVHVVACRLFSAKANILNQCWLIVDWGFKNNLHWNFSWNTNFIPQDNFENVVCKYQPFCFGIKQVIWVPNKKVDALVCNVVSCVHLICDSVFNPYHVQVWKSRDVRWMRYFINLILPGDASTMEMNEASNARSD